MTEFFDVPGGRIACDVADGGPLVVFSHGVGVRRQACRFLAPMLAQAEGVLRPMSGTDPDLVSVLTLAARERQTRGRGWWSSLRGAAGRGGEVVMPESAFLPEPFTVQASPEALADLRARLRAARWPDAPEDAGRSLGTDAGYLRDLVAYWADGFDWAAQEKALSEFPRFRARLGGVGIHYVHARGVNPAGPVLPLVLCHGWPASFWRYTKVIPLLTDPGGHGGDHATRLRPAPLPPPAPPTSPSARCRHPAAAESRNLRDGMSRRPARGSQPAATRRGQRLRRNPQGKQPDARGRRADRRRHGTGPVRRARAGAYPRGAARRALGPVMSASQGR
jgi:hypothetical protein